MNAIKANKEAIPDAALKAVIIYDEFDSAAHASTLLERAAMRAGEAIKWDIKPWRYDVLQRPTLAALTTAVAANADLIVLALHRTYFPPAEVWAWLKNWAKHRRIEDAAVLVLQADAGAHSSNVCHEMKTLAEAHNLTFLGSHKVLIHPSPSPFIRRLQPHKQLAASASPPTFAERQSVPQHEGNTK